MIRQQPEAKLLYQFIASLTLCDHMGDVGNEIVEVLEKLDSGIKPGDWEELDELADILADRGITTLYETSLTRDTEDDEL